LPFAFCLLPFAFCLLPFAFCLLPSHFLSRYFLILNLFSNKRIVKKILLFALSIFCFLLLSAQKDSGNFKSYEQALPDSAIKFKMVPVPGGSFFMGSNPKEKNKETDEIPQRKITISPFWMGAYEVSRDAFDIFYKDETIGQNSDVDAVTRPSSQYIDFSLGMGKEGGYPVNSLSQYAALMYCRWLYSKTGIFYRLPTEAEWEYACRAGSTATFYFGNDTAALGKYAWYKKNSSNKFQKAGLKLPNALGLYDMLGNVSEWTLDHYNEKALQQLADTCTDPVAAPNAARYPKTLRGGSFADDARQLRSANRTKSEAIWNRRDPQIPKSKWWLTEGGFIGFRIVRPLQQPSTEEINEFFKKYLGK
jgi:formylglycine-generating enzyme required for sulfatase activity